MFDTVKKVVWAMCWLWSLLCNRSIGCSEKLAYFLFFSCLAAGVVVLSPLLLVVGTIYCIKYLAWWLRDKVAITFVCTLGGLLVCMCGGANMAAWGAAGGFVFGAILEIIRLSEKHDPGSYLGLADRSPSGNGHQDSGIIRARSHEKPWSWRGFQVAYGPREDDFRKDI